MKDLILTLVAAEPLVITSGSAESMSHECLGYIPGNMLLGAMAAAWKRTHRGQVPDDDPGFRRLFLSGEISWGHALPLCEGQPGLPIPLCFRRVKNHPNLPAEDSVNPDQEYLVFNDLAIPEGQSHQSLWRQKHPDDAENIGIKRIAAGFMNPQTLHRVAERRVWNIHVALGKRRAALEGQLFGYSALAMGSRLQARIICHSEEARQELESLTGGLKHLCVGHSRSAGYGRVDVEPHWEDQARAETAPMKTFNLLLASQYLPRPGWANPLDNLCQELERMTGQKPELQSSFAGFEQIQGYNGLWNRPRASRPALSAGSVLRLTFANAISLPETFAIGGGQLEGYGRICVNSPFLADAMPRVGATSQAAQQNGKQCRQGGEGPIWQVLRERAASRLTERQVQNWLHDKDWMEFLEQAAKLSRPTASQRNNLRDVDERTAANFKAMLAKTPGEQWKQAISWSPFDKRRDYLSNIMSTLLDAEAFGKFYPLEGKLFQLPGKAAGKEELARYARRAHRLFVRQLISTWGKMATVKAEKE